MKINLALLGFFIRQAWPATALALPVISLFLLGYPHLLTLENPWMAVFVLLHSAALTFLLGQSRHPASAYIYTRGYSRNRLWLHKMMATGLSVLMVWGPAMLMVHLQVRSHVQDRFCNNPYFPLMTPREASVPWLWLLGYALLLPIFHYLWIRRSQPNRGAFFAKMLTIAWILAAGTLLQILPQFKWEPAWFQYGFWIMCSLLTMTALVGGRRLHRTVEIIPAEAPSLMQRLFYWRTGSSKEMHPIKAGHKNRTSFATEILMLCFLSTSVLMIGASELYRETQQSQGSFTTWSKQEDTITFSVADHRGADIWVNHTHLGQSPVRMSLKDFLEKVPYPAEPPSNVPTRCLQMVKTADDGHQVSTTLSLMMPIDLRLPSDNAKRHYYARIKHSGADGYGNRCGITVHHKGAYHVNCHFSNVYFPLRAQRIKNLINMARSSEANIDDAWLNILNAYGREAWEVLNETGLDAVMDAWVKYRHGIDSIKNEEDAWRVFTDLRRQVDVQGKYATDSLEGRALGLLLPQLNPQQLVDVAIAFIKTGRFREFCLRTHHLWNKDRSEYTKGNKLVPSECLLVDAFRRLDKQLDADDDVTPNIVETQVSRAILTWQGPVDYAAFRLAVDIGGPGLAPYLTRCWRAGLQGKKDFKHHFSTSMLPPDVNLWFYLLANLTGREGRNFRRRKADAVMALIGKLVTDRGSNCFTWGTLDFIRLDADLGEACAGAKYWPVFFQWVKNSTKNHHTSSRYYQLWRYLIMLEPAMPVAAYVQCLEAAPTLDLSLIITELKKTSVKRQLAILTGLKHHLMPSTYRRSRTSHSTLRDIARRIEALTRTLPTPATGLSRAEQEDLDYFRNHLEMLRPDAKAKETKASSAVPELTIRLYEDPPRDSAYETQRHPVEVTWAAEGLNRDGTLNLKPVRIERESLKALPLPKHGCVIITGKDQASPGLKELLDQDVIIKPWPYNMGHSLPVHKSRARGKIRLCDAEGRPIPNAALTLELVDLRKTGTILHIDICPSDADGRIVVPYVSSCFNLFTLTASHPDYGIARLNPPHPSKDGKLVAPLLKADAKGFDRAMHGIVRDGEGRPVRGAAVQVTGIKRDQASHDHTAPLNMEGHCVLTDQEGRFNITPRGRNLKSEVPPKGLYQLKITPPAAQRLPPMSGFYPNGEKLSITLEMQGNFHTIAFNTAKGPITDEGLLNDIRLTVTKNDGTRITLAHDYWRNGALLPEGRYEARIRDRLFAPLKITQESPEAIVFQEEPNKCFTGRVVHGITGAPMRSVFVLESTTSGSAHFSDLTELQWQALHGLGRRTSHQHVAVKPLLPIRKFKHLLRTDENGQFQMTRTPKNFYQFLVFDKNYLPFAHRVNAEEAAGRTDIDLGDIKLFPAARIQLSLLEKKDPVGIIPLPKMDADAPAWAGAFQSFVGFSYDRWHRVSEKPRWIHVPAGVSFRLFIRPSGHKWCPRLVSTPIYLEQGHTKILDPVQLTPTLPVTLKVVNADGQPVESAAIIRFFQNYPDRRLVGYTDLEGCLKTEIFPGEKGKFEVRRYDKKTFHDFFVPVDAIDAHDPNKAWLITLE